MRMMTTTEVQHDTTMMAQRHSALDGRHSSHTIGGTSISAGLLRARENATEWVSDGIGHHRRSGEPAMFSGFAGVVTEYLVGSGDQ